MHIAHDLPWRCFHFGLQSGFQNPDRMTASLKLCVCVRSVRFDARAESLAMAARSLTGRKPMPPCSMGSSTNTVSAVTSTACPRRTCKNRLGTVRRRNPQTVCPHIHRLHNPDPPFFVFLVFCFLCFAVCFRFCVCVCFPLFSMDFKVLRRENPCFFWGWGGGRVPLLRVGGAAKRIVSEPFHVCNLISGIVVERCQTPDLKNSQKSAEWALAKVPVPRTTA